MGRCFLCFDDDQMKVKVPKNSLPPIKSLSLPSFPLLPFLMAFRQKNISNFLSPFPSSPSLDAETSGGSIGGEREEGEGERERREGRRKRGREREGEREREEGERER